MDASNEQPTARADLPLADDIAEINREVQVGVNDVKAAQAALDAANARLDGIYAAVLSVSPNAVAFINDFRNPATPEPAPIVPDVPASVVTVESPAVNEGAGTTDGAIGAQGE